MMRTYIQFNGLFAFNDIPCGFTLEEYNTDIGRVSSINRSIDLYPDKKNILYEYIDNVCLNHDGLESNRREHVKLLKEWVMNLPKNKGVKNLKYYISDLHFGHKKCIEFDSRPFASVEEMNETLITKWNNKVKDNDEVYILGDFCYRSERDVTYYLKRLNGRKHLIVGNHDRAILNHSKVDSLFESINTLAMIQDGSSLVVLCHYPLAEWNMERYGTIHLYGHIHTDKGETYAYMQNKKNAYNVGCMLHNYEPVSLEELIGK